jgi:PAS domain S-box-containing protein
MSEALPRSPQPRGRIPHWREIGQAERFAGVLALTAVAGGLLYLAAERTLVGALCLAIAALLLALWAASTRGAPHWVLGLGTPLVMTVGALALLHVTHGRFVAAAALLAAAPAVAVLGGASRDVSLAFLAATLVGSVATALLAPGEAASGAEPWIADARARWPVAPLAAIGFLLARAWTRAHGAWRDHVIAAHAVVAASEARFKAYVENAHDVTAELDARGRVLFITERSARHYALPVAQLLGTNGGDYVHPDDLPAARRAFEAAALGRACVSEPIRYRGAHEGWRSLRVAVSSYRTRAGKLRFVLQARDVTAEVEALRAREARVAELEASLARAQARLSDGEGAPRSEAPQA